MNRTLVIRKSQWGGIASKPQICVNVAALASLPTPSSLLLLLAQVGIPLECGRQLVLQKGRQFFGGLFEKRAARVGTVHMQVQVLLGGASVAAVLADVQLVPALLVGVLLLHPVDFLQVGLQGAALGEGLVADITLVGANACMRADVPLQVEGVVEALAAEGAQVPLHLVVALEVPVEHALQAEALAAQVTAVNRRVAARACGER